MKNQGLQEVRDLLVDATQQGDERLLASALAGRNLPSLGGNQYYADIMIQALSGVPSAWQIPAKLAELAAVLCIQKADELKERLEKANLPCAEGISAQGVGRDVYEFLFDETYIFNLFLFSSYLPRTATLFSSLAYFHEVGLLLETFLSDVGRSLRQLRGTIIRHQTDDRFEELWFSALKPDQARGLSLTDEQLNGLLQAWRAMLWIPPPEAQCEVGETLDLERLEKGLLCIAETMAGRPEEEEVLVEFILRRLDQTYGRTPEFWQESFSPRLGQWPENLTRALATYWPIFATDGEGWISFSAAARAVWDDLAEDVQNTILAEAKTNQWKKLNNITFFLDVGARLQIPSIKSTLQAHFNLTKKSNTAEKKTQNKPAKERPTHSAKRKKSPTKGKKKSSRDAFARVQNVLEEIKSRLESRDFANAEKFLNDLLKRQRQEGVDPALIAKTLCNAAAMVTRFSRYQWAEDLYKEAQDANPDDVVAHTGLAETLRSQGKFVEAEALYRQTASRWPENAVVQNGLAETLRSQGKFVEAEALYRQTASRWPEDAVARNGLAETLRSQGKFAEAEVLYRQIVFRWPDNEFAQTGLAETLRSQGKFTEAEAIYRDNMIRWPNDPVARHGLANLLRRRGGDSLAEALALIPEPEYAVGERAHYDLHLRGTILLESGKTDEIEEATRLFNKGLEARTSLKSEKLFRQSLILADLKQLHFDKAAEKATWAQQTEGMDDKILELHIRAGQNSRAPEVTWRYKDLQANRVRLIPKELEAFEFLVETFHLDVNDENIPPLDLKIHDQLISLEIDMLLQAA